MTTVAKLEDGFQKNEESPGITERVDVGDGLYMARALGIPREGNLNIRLANLSDKTIILKKHKVVGRFFPLHQDRGEVCAFSLEKIMS